MSNGFNAALIIKDYDVLPFYGFENPQVSRGRRPSSSWTPTLSAASIHIRLLTLLLRHITLANFRSSIILSLCCHQSSYCFLVVLPHKPALSPTLGLRNSIERRHASITPMLEVCSPIYGPHYCQYSCHRIWTYHRMSMVLRN